MLFIVWVSVLLGVCSGQDPCTSAINIGNPRRSVTYIPPDDAPMISDNSLTSDVWYNFDSYSGSKMPEDCIEQYHCGTATPVWINGTHPTEIEVSKEVTVCASDYRGCCFWSSQIGIRRCEDEVGSEFFVYRLVPTMETRSAYCAGDGLACRAGHTWNSITQSCQSNPTMSSTPVLGTPYISDWLIVNGTNRNRVNATKFSINCSINHQPPPVDDGLRFKIRFRADGQTIATFIATSTNPVAVMGEEYLRGHIGKTLVCTATAFLESYYPDPDESSPMQSEGFKFQLQTIDENANVVSSSLLIPVGQTVRLRLKSSFPITLEYCMRNLQIPCRINYDFEFKTGESAISTQCSIAFTQGNIISGDFIVASGINSLGPTEKPEVLTFRMYHSNQDDIFEGYKVDDIQMVFRDPNAKPLCRAYADPHIITFNQISLSTQLTGVFYMARTNHRVFEIQARFSNCGRADVTCVCGVIAREGNSIIGINGCDHQVQPLRVQYLLDETSPGARIAMSTIYLSSGISIEINVVEGSLGPFLNIWIRGLNTEPYEGICSNETTSSVDWNDHRVPPEESFFNLSESNPPKCKNLTEPASSCHCHERGSDSNSNVTKVHCDQDQSEPMLMSRYTCVGNVSQKISPFTEPDMDFISLDYINSKIDHSKDTFVETVNRNWPTPSGITEQQATDQCNNFFRSSPSYTLCSPYTDVASFMQTCALDIQFTDNLNSTTFSENVLENSCLYEIKSLIPVNDDPPSAEAEDLLDKLETVESNVCPSTCQNGGTCINSTCTCRPGFLGGDCSMMEGQQPTVHELISYTCDVRENPCRTVYVNARHVLNTDKLTCRFESAVTGIHYSPGMNTFGNLVYCTLPSNPVSTLDDEVAVTSYSVSVSLSNDQSGYGNAMTFTVFDSVCMSCNGSSCQQKSSTCAIKGRCRIDGEVCQFDTNKVCESSKCVSKWSTQITRSCADGDDVCVYIDTTTTPSTTSTSFHSGTTTIPPVRCPDQDNGNGFRCDTNHPCTVGNIGRGCYLFPYTDVYNFIRCDGVDQCNVVPCDPGFIWSKQELKCDRAAGSGTASQTINKLNVFAGLLVSIRLAMSWC